MRNVFGPEIPTATLSITTGETPAAPVTPAPVAPAAPVLPDVTIDFQKIEGTGPVHVTYGFPVIDPAKNAVPAFLRVAVIPTPTDAAGNVQPVTLPDTADAWLADARTQVFSVDVSQQLAGGSVTVSATLPNGKFAAKTILSYPV